MSTSVKSDDGDEDEIWVELDSRVYGSKQNWEDVDLAVGRIFGLTVSDCSAYVARVLFFEELARPEEPKALLVLVVTNKVEEEADGFREFKTLRDSDELKDHLEEHIWTPGVQESFDGAWPPVCGANERLSDAQEKEVELHYPEASLILYTGHGQYDGFRDHAGVDPMSTSKLSGTCLKGFPVILAVACSTGAYERTQKTAANSPAENKPKLANLFVAQNIRRGAMAQQCAVSPAYWHDQLDDLLKALYVDGHSIGDAVRQAKNSERSVFRAGEIDNGTDYKFDGDPHYLLVGDPTFEPKAHRTSVKEETMEIQAVKVESDQTEPGVLRVTVKLHNDSAEKEAAMVNAVLSSQGANPLTSVQQARVRLEANATEKVLLFELVVDERFQPGPYTVRAWLAGERSNYKEAEFEIEKTQDFKETF